MNTAILTIFALISIIHGLVVRRSYELQHPRSIYPIADFSFRPGGLFRLRTNAPLKVDPNKPLDKVFLNRASFKFIPYDNWSRFSKYIRDKDADPCNVQEVSLNVEATVSVGELQNISTGIWKKSVNSTVRYELVLFNCEVLESPATISFEATMVNINPDGTETHLSEDQLRHPIIQLIFFGVFWPLLWILWWVNWWRNRQETVWIYAVLALSPALHLIQNFLAWIGLLYFSRNGEDNLIIFIVSILVNLAWSFLFAAARILLSKGYCITRLKLLKVEWRTVYGTALFVSISDTFQNTVAGGAVVSYLAFLCLLYTYIWLNFRHQKFVLGDFLCQLTQNTADKDIQKVYQDKYNLIDKLNRVIIGFGAVYILVCCLNYLFASSVTTPFIVVHETIIFLETASVGFLIRLHATKEIDLSPDKKEDPGAIEAERTLGLRIRELLLRHN